jgi:hypothetical protein
MRESLPTRLLLMLVEATPDKLAAVERFLADQTVPVTKRTSPPEGDPASRKLRASVEGDPSSGNFCIRVAPANEASPGAVPEPIEPSRETLSLAGKVFELLTALDAGGRIRKAPPIKVFNLYYRQGLQPGEIARKCGCDPSVVFDRLKAIKKHLPWTPEQLREVSSQVEAMEDAVRDSRAKDIYLKGAFSGDEQRDDE